MDRAARRLRGGQALPDAAHHPRRPVLAVRRRLLRRGPGARRRRATSSSISNPRGGSGYSEEHGRAIRGPLGDAGPGWGTRRLRRPDGRRRHRARAVRLRRPRAARRARRLVRRLHDDVDHRPHEPLQGGGVRARREQPRVSMFGSSDLFWVFQRQFGGALWENIEAFSRSRRRPTGRRSRRRCSSCIRRTTCAAHRAGRASVHAAAPARQAGRDGALPGGATSSRARGSPFHRVIRFETILDWFDRYLKSHRADLSDSSSRARCRRSAARPRRA